jgi:hypothetical protein
MVDVINDLLRDGKTILIAALGVMVIWFIIWTLQRTRALVPTLGAVILGAAVLWAAANIPTVQREIDEDITRYSADR